MNWSKDNYPDSMKHLEKLTRNKAIEIANSLLKDGYEEPRAIAMAITQAQVWASKRKITKSNGSDRHIVPHKGKWAILKEGNIKPSHIYNTKEEALKKAYKITKDIESKVVSHKKDGKII